MSKEKDFYRAEELFTDEALEKIVDIAMKNLNKVEGADKLSEEEYSEIALILAAEIMQNTLQGENKL